MGLVTLAPGLLALAVLATALARAPDPDSELVAQAQRGDRRAFAELYRRHVDWIYARLTRLIGPVPDREDVLQQIFLDVHRSLPSFRGEAAFSTFLYRVVANHAYDHLGRRRRAALAALDDDTLDSLVAPTASPESRARARQALRLALTLLERLKPAKRVAFVLVAIDGLSLEEAAEVVGAKVPAVKQRVLAARRELKAMLDRREATP